MKTAYSSRRTLLVGAGATTLGLPFPSNRGAAWADAPTVLKPFDPSRPGGKAPRNLPARIGAVSPTPEGLNKSINDAVRQRAKDWGVDFLSASGNGTAESVVEQGTLLLNRWVGLFYSFVTNREAEAPMLQRALDAGVNCANVAGCPCTMQLNGSRRRWAPGKPAPRSRGSSRSSAAAPRSSTSTTPRPPSSGRVTWRFARRSSRPG